MRIVATYIQTNSLVATAVQCQISERTVRLIVAKYRQHVTLKPGVGGNNKSTVMKDYVQLYIEVMLMIDPMLYLVNQRLSAK